MLLEVWKLKQYVSQAHNSGTPDADEGGEEQRSLDKARGKARCLGHFGQKLTRRSFFKQN